MRILLAMMFLTLSAGVVRADTAAAANAALKAYGKGDRTALAKLATGTDADPWLIAEELLFRGRRDAAKALATASDHRDLAALDAWLGKQKTYPADPEARGALSIALALLGEGKAKKAGETLKGLTTVAAEPTSIRIVSVRGIALRRLGRATEAVAVFARAGELAAKLGWLRRAAESYAAATRAALDGGTPHLATTPARSRLAVEERRGNAAGQVAALTDLGRAYRALSEPARAETELTKAGKLASAQGDRAGVARVELERGHVALDRGRPDVALGHFALAQELAAKVGEQSVVAGSLAGKARVDRSRGRLPAALDLLIAAVAVHEAAGDRRELGTALSDLGNLYRAMNQAGLAARSFARANELLRAVGDRAGLVVVLTNQAALSAADRRYAEAIKTYDEALVLARQLGDAYGTALIQGNLGELLTRERKFARAKKCLEESIRIRGELGDRAGIGIALGNLGLVHAGAGRPDAAVEIFTKALAISSEYGPIEAALLQTRSLAAALYESKRYAESVRASRRAAGLLNRLCRQLPARQAALTRTGASKLFAVGLEASVLANDPAGVFFFVEAGRASRLLGIPGTVDLFEIVRLPADLRAAVVAAISAEGGARRSFRAAIESRSPADIGRTKNALAGAGKATHAALDRLRTEAPLVADLFFPVPFALGDVQPLLDPAEAMVLYGGGLGRSYALVVTAKEARIVLLGHSPQVKAVCAALSLVDTMELPAEALADARRRLVEPLGLVSDVRRVLVSPLGVSTAALFPGRGVVCLPSAAVWARNRARPWTRGQGILDLGPDDGQSRWSETIPKRSGRWRAVHLAATGVVELRPPVGPSSVPVGKGIVMAQRILAVRVTADLFMLTATKGVPGPGLDARGLDIFTRSFMIAGAPRVLVSLWRVDEKAKKAFLTEFFRLWNPPDDGKALSAAEALRKAQEHVRSQKGWDHPHYWAAWQLWGV